MDALVLNAGQREQEVRDLKREISDMVRFIQRLNGDLEALLRKVRITQIDIARVQTYAHFLFVQPTSDLYFFSLFSL